MTEEIVVTQQDSFLAPVVSVEAALRAYQAKKDLIDKILVAGVDFGVVPGSAKPTLLKPGAEKMTSFFGLSPIFEDVVVVEDWTGADHGGEPFFYYRQKCILYRGDRIIATADGSCNSWEKKYRYRNADRVCPQCGKSTIIKGKEEYGGGWLCYAKKGGCGAKFGEADQSIVGQEVGQIKNMDVAEQVNTILKISQKRSLVAVTLIATGVSDYFTQDIDDFVPGEIVDVIVKPAPVAATKKESPIEKGVRMYNELIVEAKAWGIVADPLPENVTIDVCRSMYNDLKGYIKDVDAQENAEAYDVK